MSDEHQNGTIEDDPTRAKEKLLQEKRGMLQKLSENKEYVKLIDLSFNIIHDKEIELIPDALDALRQAIPDNPRLLNETQINVLADLLNDADDMLRASAVLALKPVIPEKSNELFKILAGFIDSPQKSKNCKEEAIRLLGHMATLEPERVTSLIPRFISFLTDEDVHVRKRSLEALKVLGKHAPAQIERGIKGTFDQIKDEELIAGVNELVTSIIKRRELRDLEQKSAADEKRPELIPEMAPEIPKETPAASKSEPVVSPTAPAQEQKSDVEIRKEIDAKIQEEFSKIEDGKKPADIPLKDMKEIKTEKDLESRAPAEMPMQKPAAAPAVVEQKIVVPIPKEQPTTMVPPAPVQHDVPDENGETHADLVKKQLELKEKMLQKREEELKRLQIERKELELVSQELEMERDELIKTKLEKLEVEVKRKEQELKEKELSLKLKELEERDQKIKEAEGSRPKND